MDGSPSVLKNANPRRYLLMMQSQSQPRFHFSKDLNHPQDRKNQKPNITSLLSRTNTSSVEKTPSNNQSHLDKISDFYDKKQIKDAISSVGSLKGRIKLVDSIVKRRVEIREIEDQTRFERVAPIIHKASETLRSRVLERTKENRVRKSIFLDCLKNSGLQDPTTIQSEAVSRASPNNSINEGRKFSHGFETPKDIALIHSVLSKIAEARAESRAESRMEAKIPLQDSVLLEPTTTDESPMKQTTLGSPVSTSRSQFKRASNILALLTKSAKKPTSDSPRGLVFDSVDKPTTRKGSPPPLLLRTTTRSLGTKRENSHTKSGSLSRDTYGIGGKVLEKDIYTYLMKHDQTQEISKFIANTDELKEPLMRDIEIKAKAKWFNFQGKKKQLAYMLPNSLVVKSNSNEKTKFMTGPCKCSSYEVDPEARSPNHRKLKAKGIKSSSVVRLVKNEGLSPQVSLRSPEEPEIEENNESFVSITESRLDKLYRNSHGINKMLFMMNDQMKEIDDREQMRRWEEYKQRKIDTLNDNSKESIKAIDRKMFKKGL